MVRASAAMIGVRAARLRLEDSLAVRAVRAADSRVDKVVAAVVRAAELPPVARAHAVARRASGARSIRKPSPRTSPRR